MMILNNGMNPELINEINDIRKANIDNALRDITYDDLASIDQYFHFEKKKDGSIAMKKARQQLADFLNDYPIFRSSDKNKIIKSIQTFYQQHPFTAPPWMQNNNFNNFSNQ